MTKMINTPEHALNVSEYVVCTTIQDGEYYITGNKQFEQKILYKLSAEQFERTTDGHTEAMESILEKLGAPMHLAAVAIISHKHKHSFFGFSSNAKSLETLVVDGYNVDQLEYPMDIMEIPPAKIIADIRANPYGKDRELVH